MDLKELIKKAQKAKTHELRELAKATNLAASEKRLKNI
jgi:hypothetical protein